MPKSDGSVIIDTNINTSGFEQGMTDTQREIQKTEAKLDKLIEKQIRYYETGGNVNNRTFKLMEYDIEQATAKLESLRAKELEESQAIRTRQAAQQQSINTNQMYRNTLELIKSSFANMGPNIRSAAASMLRFASGDTINRAKNLSKHISRLAGNVVIGGIRKLTGAFKGLGSQITGVGKKAKNTRGSLLSMVGTMFGIGSAFMVIRRAFTAMRDGMNNLVQYSSEANRNMSALKSSLTQLKNSLATAFSPILTLITPMLVKFINLLSSAASAVGAFFSALSGKKTYSKAVAVQEDYAASLNSTSKNADKAKKSLNKYLSGLDEIRTFTSKQDEENPEKSSGISPAQMFTEAEIEGPIAKFADKVKEVFSKIFDVLGRAWENKGQSVINSAKAAFESLREAISSIGATWLEVWTNGTGLAWVESVLEVLRSVLDVITSIATAFTDAWKSGAGFENVTALFNMLTKINHLIVAISDSFSRAFNNGVGVQIWENLIGIITGVYNIVGNLAESITSAWNTAGAGDGIWSGILNTVNNILTFIHDIVDATSEWAANLDFYPLLESIANLFESLSSLIKTIGDWISENYETVILPIAKWIIEEALPAIINAVSDLFNFLSENFWIIETIGTLLISAFAASKIVSLINSIIFAVTNFKNIITLVVSALGGPLTIVIAGVIAALILLVQHWDGVKAAIEAFVLFLSESWEAIKTATAEKWNEIKESLSEAWNSIKDNASQIWEKIKNAVKSPINGIIGFINKMISAVTSGINSVINLLNGFHFDIPDWIPGLGGKSFGLSIPTLTAPQIPYLATGAVIPPNAPFMAMLGDQKHGNNIEAPENLIRRIVREESGNNSVPSGNVTLPIYMDGNKIFEVVIEKAKLLQASTGRNVLAELR